MESVAESTIKDVNAEMLVVGSFFKNPNLLLDYADKIRSKHDFHESTPRFLYNSIYELFEQHTNGNIDEIKTNIFMNQDEERQKIYKSLGGYQFISRLEKTVDLDDFPKYYDNLKKFSLLRELDVKGFPLQKLMNSKDFLKMSAEDVVKGLEYTILTISTEVGGAEDSIILGRDIKEVRKGWKKKPDFGLPVPFSIFNSLIRGLRKTKFNLMGMHSGCGKSRITSFIIAYVGLVLQEKVLVLVNEQEKDEWDAMLLSAVINNPVFGFVEDPVEGIDETSIVTGQYTEEQEKIIERAEDFIAENSKIHWMYLSKFDYNTIKRQIKRHKIKGCNFFLYDTLKSSDHDWLSFVKIADMLKEICGELKVSGLATFQLTDDSLFDEILTSKAIASGKHIKHVADSLGMFRVIPKEDYDKYYIYDPDDKFKNTKLPLQKEHTYYSMVVDKNRGGKDKDLLCFRVDKGKNYWCEVGYLVRKETPKKNRQVRK